MTSLSSFGSTRVSLVQFPGSNCDADCIDAFDSLFGIKLNLVWHMDTKLNPTDAVILPGGFSYGDYLRGGALAAHSPIMGAIKDYAKKGGPILGVCNGFQILTESQLLPGVLLRNAGRKFICSYTTLKGVSGPSGMGKRVANKLFRIPIAHGEGRYFLGERELKKAQDEGMILFQYATEAGDVSTDANPNGASANIAGIISPNGKVIGMMPHPERATDPLLGGSDAGKHILQAFLETAL